MAGESSPYASAQAGGVVIHPWIPSAPDGLRHAAEIIDHRAIERDLANGERSMARTVAAFNALTGSELTEMEGWLFMTVLKVARATAGKAQPDDLIDAAAYCALALESLDGTAADREL